jgi:AcrR family transcriptional regulator
MVRDDVLAAATRLFAAHGVGATAVQDVADEVGVTKAAVLHHFGSKEALRKGVLDAILAHWRQELPKLLLAATASDERFDSVLDAVYRFFAASTERARVIVREALDRPAEARAMLRSILPVLEGVAGYIRRGEGRDLAIDAEAYVIHVMQMIIGAAAVGDVTAPVLGAGAPGWARDHHELARIAKVALFGDARRPRPASGKTPRPASGKTPRPRAPVTTPTRTRSTRRKEAR